MNFPSKLKFPLIFSIVCLLATCKKDNETTRDYPRVNTMDVSNITEKGATFQADVYSEGKEEIIDHGFVWGISENNLSFQSNDRVSLSEFTGTGLFETEIKTTLEAKKQYYVRSFVKTAKYVVYGKVVSFVSLGSGAPTIIGFAPKTAGWGDTIIIKGKNFSRLITTNKVYFGSNLVSVYPKNSISNDSTLSVMVPDLLDSIRNLIAVEIAGNKVTFTKDTFKLIPPIITYFIPKQGYWGDTIKVLGNYLNGLSNSSANSLKLNQIKCPNIINSSKNSISFIVPNEVEQINNQLSVSINGIILSASGSFQFLPPIFTDFKPKSAFYNDKITLYGKFNPNPAYNAVYFDANYKATIQSAYRDSLIVLVPSFLTVNSPISYKSRIYTVNSPQNFVLVSPSIESFTPTSGVGGVLITLTSKNFFPGNVSIYFNDTYATVNSINSATIKAYVPNGIAGKVKLKLKSGNQIVESKDSFNITNPLIKSFSPKTATFRDTITISGENFNPSGTMVQLIDSWSTPPFGTNYNARIVSITPTLIKAVIPDITGGESKKVVVTVGANFSIANDYFTLHSPVVTSITPNSGGANQKIVIEGDNFGYINLYGNYVQVGNFYATVESTERKKIVASIDKVTRGEHKIVVNWGSLKSQEQVSYQCNSPWLLIKPHQDSYFYITSGYSFVYDNKGYIYIPSIYSNVSIYHNTLFSLNPTDNSITETILPTLPNDLNFFNTTNFSYQNKIYRVSGQRYVPFTFTNTNNVYSFDIGSNLWKQLSDFPGDYRQFGFSFTFPTKAYVGGGGKYDFWEYYPANDSWLQKTNTPFTTSEGKAMTVSINDKGYIILYDKSVWEYNSVNDIWTQKSSFPGNSRYFPICFAIGDIIYYGSGRLDYSYLGNDLDDFWIYNTQNDSWIQKQSLPGQKRGEASTISIGNKGYFGLGRNSYNNNYKRITDFYEYDPTLEP